MITQNPTIIFDFDGTIANSLPYTLKIFREFAQDRKRIDLNKLDFSSIRDKSINQLISQYKVPLYQIPALIIKGQRLLKTYMQEIKPFPRMKNLLSALWRKKFTMGIISSNSRDNIEIFLKNHSLGDFFRFVHSEKNLFGKDRSLKRVIKKYGLNKHNLIYIGDEIRDVEACQKVGIPIIAVSWGFNSRKALQAAKANYLIDKPERLYNFIINLSFTT